MYARPVRRSTDGAAPFRRTGLKAAARIPTSLRHGRLTQARGIEFKKMMQKNEGGTPTPSEKSKTTSEVICRPFNDLCVFGL